MKTLAICICLLIAATVALGTPTGNEINTVEDTSYCLVCEYVIGYIKNALVDQSVVQKIETALKQFCTKLPFGLDDRCTGVVDTYVDMIITWIPNEIDPNTICTVLMLCSGRPRTFADFEHSINNGFRSDADKKCPMCLSAVAQIQTAVRNKQLVDDLKAILDEHACAKLPMLKNLCSNLVTQFVDHIAHRINSEVEPNAVCRDLGSCSNDINVALSTQFENELENLVNEMFLSTKENTVSSNRLNPDESNIGDNPMVCSFCQMAITQLEEELKTQKDVILNTLKSLCQVLPSPYPTMCDGMVDTYFDFISNLIVTTAPKDICVKISLCSP